MAIDISLGQLLNSEKLSDGDIVTATLSPGGIQSDRIGIALRLDGVHWWKGIQSGAIVLCQAQDSQNFISTSLAVSDFKSNGLQLWKAKLFGAHTQMYNITDATEKIQGGQSYLFTWKRD
jgi:hypothetical protein